MKQLITTDVFKKDLVKQSLIINRISGTVTGEFRLFTIKENGHIILYLPAIGISGYGDSVLDAKNMLNESVHDYFKNLLLADEAVAMLDLQRYGWTKSIYKTKHFQNDTYVDANGVLNNFQLPEGTEIEESIAEMA